MNHLVRHACSSFLRFGNSPEAVLLSLLLSPVGNRIFTEGTSSICCCNCCNCSGMDIFLCLKYSDCIFEVVKITC